MFESQDDHAQFRQIVDDIVGAGKALNDMACARCKNSVLRNFDFHDGVMAPEPKASGL